MSVVGESGVVIDEEVLNLFNYKAPGPVSEDFIKNSTLKNPALLAGIMGPYGSGKTMACLVRHLAAAIHQVPPDHNNVIKSRLVVVREDYPSLEGSAIRSMEVLLEALPAKAVKWKYGPPHECHVYAEVTDPRTNRQVHVHLEYIFLSIGDKTPRQLFGGREYTFGYINEAMIPEPYYQFLLTRCARYPALRSTDKKKLKPLVWIDFNAPNNDDWLAKTFIFSPKPRVKLWQQPSGLSAQAENLDNLADGYYDNMVKLNPEEFVNQYVHCELGNRTDIKSVFKKYNESVHVGDFEFMPDAPLNMGADAGLNPAIVFWQTNGFGQMVIVGEQVGFDISVEDFGLQVKEYMARNFGGFTIGSCVVDPTGDNKSATASASQSWMRLMNEYTGLQFREALTNNWDMRKSAVDNGLGRRIGNSSLPRMVISRRCEWLRQGMAGGYHYNEKRQMSGEFHNQPMKNKYSHVCDALQYACCDNDLGEVNPRGRHNTKELSFNNYLENHGSDNNDLTNILGDDMMH